MSTTVSKETRRLAIEAAATIEIMMDYPDKATKELLMHILGKMADIIVLNKEE